MDDQWVSVKVHPLARKDVLVAVGSGRFEAWVRAKPVAGRANEAVAALLAQHFRISPQRLRLVKGHDGRRKVFRMVESS